MAKSKQTLEGLAAEQSQLKVNLEKIEALEDKIKTEMETLKTKMINMNDELNVFGDLDRLRSEAAEKRQLLESEHLSLGTRKTASVQNANTVQVFIPDSNRPGFQKSGFGFLDVALSNIYALNTTYLHFLPNFCYF